MLVQSEGAFYIICIAIVVGILLRDMGERYFAAEDDEYVHVHVYTHTRIRAYMRDHEFMIQIAIEYDRESSS